MSAIAGFVRFDGAPLDRVIVDGMAARLSLRGFSLTELIDERCGVIFGTRGSDHLPQPLTNASAHTTVVIDGRIDNRMDLIRKLDLAAGTHDAGIALAAYAKWGADFAARLLGDYAIAIVDHRVRQVVCARDVFGNRRLHYRAGAGWLAFASSIDCLVAAIDPLPEINEGMAGELLASFVVTEHETLYQGVYRLPAAHLLIAADGHLTTRRYWTPAAATLRYSTDAQYEEHLHSLLSDAVIACLRTSMPAAVMLSGGLDSSSVTALAARAINTRIAQAPALETFSMVGSGDADESVFTSAVAASTGLVSHQIHQQRPKPGQFREEIALDYEPQVFPHSPTIDVLRAQVRDRGMRVVLTGVGGDDWLGTAPEAYADLLRRGRLLALMRRLYLDRGEDHDPGWWFVARAAVWPLLPLAIQSSLRQLLRRGQPPPWIAADFAKRIALADRMAAYRPARMFDTHEQDANWFESMNGWRMFVTEMITRGADRFGLDLAHPFFDRRLVEFCLALPADQLWRDGRPKDLLRRTMRDVVPAAVRARRASPSGDDAFLDVLDVEGGAASFADLDLERRGWIDGAVARAMHASLASAPTRQRASYGRILWGIKSLEYWQALLTVRQ